MKKTKILTAVLLAALIIASAVLTLTSCSDKISFKIEITDNNGDTKTYTVSTAEKTVGDALIEAGYISADSKDAGFFSTLNGITADWNVDQSYWAFYIGDDYAPDGVFGIEVVKGAVYKFVYTREGETDAVG